MLTITNTNRAQEVLGTMSVNCYEIYIIPSPRKEEYI